MTNATLNLGGGVALGLYSTNGLVFRDGSSLFSTGRPDRLNTLVRYQSVQEDQQTILGGAKTPIMSFIKVIAPNTNPEMKFQFTRANLLADVT